MTPSSVTRNSRHRGMANARVWQVLCCAFLGIIVILAAQAAFAQGYGKITGIVTDPTGAAVQGAKITLTQTATGTTTSTTSGNDGNFVFPSLRPADYRLSATSTGFTTFNQTGIVLQADAALTIKIGLKLGSISESVSVEANTVQVDTTTATLAQVVDQQRIVDLPLNGRNAASLTTLVAGVVVAPTAQADQGNTKTFPVVVMVTANGSRAGQTNYLLDGGNNVDEYTNVNAPFPFPDALQEFSVQTSNYNAEYGQNSGGVVNIITRGGSTKYHGTLFEYNRNAAYNAANFFGQRDSHGDKLKDPLKRNQFGGAIGGPFKFPGLSTPRSFFFAGYQGTILRNSPLNDSAATLPTQGQLNGIFSVAKGTTANPTANCIKNPFTGVTYPCTATADAAGLSTVDTRDYNAAALKLLDYLPNGDASGTAFFRKPTRDSMHEVMGRFDHEFNNRDKFAARYFYDRYHHGGRNDTTNLLTYFDESNIAYHNLMATETHMFSDRILNTFLFNWQRNRARRGPLAGGINVADLGVNIWQPSFKQINQVQVSPGFTIGDNPAATFYRYSFTFKDDLRWVRGSHSLAFGFLAARSQVDINNQYRQPGVFTFNATNTNNAMASYLLGYLFQFQQASGQFFNNRGIFVGFYAQDSWKVNRRLTLSYGVRYEPFIPWRETQNRMGAFSPTAFVAGRRSNVYVNAPIGLLFPGDQGMTRDGIEPVHSGFMPRIGFAWDIFGTGRTSVRGGFGMFYDTRISSVFNNIYSNSSPFITNFSITNPAGGFSNPYQGVTNPFPASQPPPKTFVFPTGSYLTFNPFHSFQTPRTYNWNLIVEQQLYRGSLVRVAYVGSHASHLWLPVELNPAVFNATTGSATRVYAPTYTEPITFAEYSGNSSYNSMQLSFEQRFKSGISVLANYTWSKSLDNMPYNASVTAIGASASYVLPTYEPNYKRLDYGPSDFNHRNVFSLSYVWQLPKIKDGPSAFRYIFNDWQTNGIFQFRSGNALTIVSGSSNNSKTGQNRDRAVFIGGDPYAGGACTGVTSPCKAYLNPAAFTANIAPTTATPNPAMRYGNVAKGFLVGPQFATWDFSMMRTFKLHEQVKLEFRAEYFNLLNHTNFNDPGTSTGSSLGRITGAADPRIGQFSLKLSF
jgi:hypothetical protein